MPSGFPKWLEWEMGRGGLQMSKRKGSRAGGMHGSRDTPSPGDTCLVGGLEVEDEISQQQHSQGPACGFAGRTQAEGTGRGDTETQPVSCWPDSGANMNLLIT